MVRYAYESVPYYRDTMSRLGLRPTEFVATEDLAKLPIIERRQLQLDPEYFVSRRVRLSKCLKLQSSGSSGAPKTIWHDPAAVFQNAAHGERERSMIVDALGRWSGHRETVLVSPFDASQRAVQEFVRKTAYLPFRLQVKRQYLLLSDPPEKNVRLMNEFRPDLLYSYGSYAEMIFTYLQRSKVDWHHPKAILYSSDHLSWNMQHWIMGELGIPVFTVYGAVEALKIAFSCQEQKGLHHNCDLYPVRIVRSDGEEAEPGTAGEVVISNLVNHATVLLNYRLGDLAIMEAEPCSCGRTLPLISHPVGRVDEVVELADGSTIHPIVFREICLRHPGILQYQVRQTEPGEFCVSIVPASDTNQQDIARTIHDAFRQQFGGNVKADVRFVDELKRTTSGKTPAIIALHAQPAAALSRSPQHRG
jgi:phenylacetate-CoA ligase